MIHSKSSSSGSEIPLKFLKVHALLQNSLARLTISQTFINATLSPLECEYHLPTYSQGVVTDLKIRLPDGSFLSSEIIEKEKALEKYQDTISQGHSAALAIQQNNSEFIITLGNLLPNDSIEVLINCVYPLQSEKDFWEFQFISGFIPLGIKKYNLEFIIEVKSDCEIMDYSSTWVVIINKSDDGKRLIANIDESQFNPDTNLVFKYSTASIIIPKCLIQQRGSKYAAMLSFIPYCDKTTDIFDLESTAEFIFVLDRSGSMDGTRIELAKNAALLFLKSLPSVSKFNIVSFGSEYSFMFPQSVYSNSQNISNAISLLSSFSADMGGTEIYNPLQEVFSIPIDKAYPRFIFLLTDGDVSNIESVINLIKKNSRMNRVNCFGIEDANKRLIEGGAEAGKGLAYFIKDAKEIGKNVINALEQCMVPCISDWEVIWTGDLVPKPKDFGVVKYGEKFEIFSLIENISENLPVLKVYDTNKGGYKEFHIEKFEEIDGDEIFKLWAKNKIEELEVEVNKDKVIEISKEFKVISKETAFICVKTNSDGSQGDIVTVKIEKNIVKDIGPDMDDPSSSNSVRAVARCCYVRGGVSESESESEEKEEEEEEECENDDLEIDEQFFEPPKPDILTNCYEKQSIQPIPTKEEVMIEFGKMRKIYAEENILLKCTITQKKKCNFIDIVSLVDSEGFWEWSDLLSVLNLSYEKSKEIFSVHPDNRISATILAITYLNKHFANEKNEWILIERKTLRWLKKLSIETDALCERVRNYLD
ncbi:hypothetical protein SteCoe_28973 [Stentor coeruleus]|uniref:VWFA domain-containing protein n=1 Tax=Stentor coeruleus TaxID=5963 RepID=A0A1R2B714_9CILI|nr:hypothetical protein SteCoe_28973 [Stentor coeruleus]